MAEDLLSASVLRQIGHSAYDKRKLAALEVEQTVKRLSKSHDETRIQKLVDKVRLRKGIKSQSRRVCAS